MKSVLAPVIFSSVLFAAAFSRKPSTGAPPWTPPAPTKLPPFPTGMPKKVPDPPWALPPLPPMMINVTAGHRYEVVADVQAAVGVGMTSAAGKILDALQLSDPSLKGFKNVERPGVGTCTRVTLQVTPLVDGSFPLDQKLSTPGIGSCWVVSIKEVAK